MPLHLLDHLVVLGVQWLFVATLCWWSDEAGGAVERVWLIACNLARSDSST